MKYVLIMAAMLTIVPLTLVTTTSHVSAKKWYDNPNSGYCPGTNRRTTDLRRCKRPGAAPKRVSPATPAADGVAALCATLQLG